MKRNRFRRLSAFWTSSPHRTQIISLDPSERTTLEKVRDRAELRVERVKFASVNHVFNQKIFATAKACNHFFAPKKIRV